MSVPPWGQITSCDNSGASQAQSAGLAAHQQQIASQQQMMHQYNYNQQQYVYQQQLNQYQHNYAEEQRKRQIVLDALLSYVLYEHGIPKERHEKYLGKCATHLLSRHQTIGTIDDVDILRELKEFVPTIKFEDQMTELLDGDDK